MGYICLIWVFTAIGGFPPWVIKWGPSHRIWCSTRWLGKIIYNTLLPHHGRNTKTTRRHKTGNSKFIWDCDALETGIMLPELQFS